VTTDTLSFPLPAEKVEEITKQAREVHPGRVVAGLIGGLLFIIGWLTAKAFGVLWFAMVWTAIAVRTGWRDAKGMPPPGPSLEQLIRENQMLRAELQRMN
jgi:hypothetical protein